MMFCGHCGQELQPGWKACPRCGAVREVMLPTTTRAFPRPFVLIAAFALLLVLIVVAVVLASGPDKPSRSLAAIDATKSPAATSGNTTSAPVTPKAAPQAGVPSINPNSTSTAVGGAPPRSSGASAASTPKPISLSGPGKSTSQRFDVVGGLTAFRAHCACKGNFVVELLDGSGAEQDVLVNVIGAYDGSVGYGLDAGPYVLKVDADKPWTVTVTQPRDTRGARMPQKFSGKGQELVGPFSAGDAIHFDAHNAGEGNFVVEIMSSDGETQDIPFNEIGNFSGSTVSNDLSGAPYYLNVDSDGTWSIDVRAP